MMPADRSLSRSIVLHGVLFFLAQGGALAVVTFAYAMTWQRLVFFLLLSMAYHAGLTALLLVRRGDFRVEASGQPLTKVNLANRLTYIRLSSLPTIVFLVIQAPDFPASLPVILPLICAVFATDFLDGMTARRRGEITFVGRYLDSASDYLTIIAITIVLYYFGMLALWFMILVLVRLVFFAVGMALLAVREGKANPLVTFAGKASIFSLMVLYAMEIARLFSVPWIGDEAVVRIVSYVVAAIVAGSMVDKAVFLARRFSEITARASGRPQLPRRSAP
jgi:phosphatidylglycerophosphate synthase